jgi:hypothetical protein
MPLTADTVAPLPSAMVLGLSTEIVETVNPAVDSWLHVQPGNAVCSRYAPAVGHAGTLVSGRGSILPSVFERGSQSGYRPPDL